MFAQKCVLPGSVLPESVLPGDTRYNHVYDIMISPPAAKKPGPQALRIHENPPQCRVKDGRLGLFASGRQR